VNRNAVEARLLLLDAGGDFAVGVIANEGRWCLLWQLDLRDSRRLAPQPRRCRHVRSTFAAAFLPETSRRGDRTASGAAVRRARRRWRVLAARAAALGRDRPA